MISFSLKSKAKTLPESTPSLRHPPAFGALEDESLDAAPTATTSSRVDTNKQLASRGSGSSKAQRRRMEEAKQVDETVYQYDEVYDRMQDAKLRLKQAKEAESKRRKPKYIENLLISAETRRLDHLRAEEKMIQREREAEGDEFADKEQFVTQAYKDQMEAARNAEREETEREAKQKKESSSTGMTHLYRQLLEQSDEQHQATVTAIEETKTPGPTAPNLTISRPPTFVPKSDKQLAEDAQASGRDVELNDDNQIVDRRELLSAGLNLGAPNTRQVGLQTRKRKVESPSDKVQAHCAVGTAATRREISERRNREIHLQLQEENDRLQKEQAEREQAELDRMAIKRNTDDQISDARARYLERKRRRVEESTA